MKCTIALDQLAAKCKNRLESRCSRCSSSWSNETNWIYMNCLLFFVILYEINLMKFLLKPEIVGDLLVLFLKLC